MKDLVDSLLAQSLPGRATNPDPTFRGCKACSLKHAAEKSDRKALLQKEMRALQGGAPSTKNKMHTNR